MCKGCEAGSRVNRPYPRTLVTLVLNWVCFLEEATSSSFGDKIISLLMFTPTVYVS